MHTGEKLMICESLWMFFYSQSFVHPPYVCSVNAQVPHTNLIRMHVLKNQYAREVLIPESFLNPNLR